MYTQYSPGLPDPNSHQRRLWLQMQMQMQAAQRWPQSTTWPSHHFDQRTGSHTTRSVGPRVIDNYARPRDGFLMAQRPPTSWPAHPYLERSALADPQELQMQYVLRNDIDLSGHGQNRGVSEPMAAQGSQDSLSTSNHEVGGTGPGTRTDPQSDLYAPHTRPLPDVSDCGTPTTASPFSNADSALTPQAARRGRHGGLNDEQRRHAKDMRKAKSCIWCAMQKQKCSRPGINGCCEPCNNRRFQTLPCIRQHVSDVRLFAIGQRPLLAWTRRWDSMSLQDIDDWASDHTTTILISQGVGGTGYAVNVKQYLPQEGDQTARQWYWDGQWYSYPTKPYALVDMEATKTVQKQFIDSKTSFEAALRHELRGRNPLIAKTYEMAYRFASRHPHDLHRQSPQEQAHVQLLRDTVRLWAAIRMETRSDFIVGDETLGMKPCVDDGPNRGRVLLSPVLSAQLNMIMYNILSEFRENVLRNLQALILDHHKDYRDHWFAIYLCVFVLLHSCSLFTTFEAGWAVKSGCSTQYRHEPLVREMHRGAEVLLAYWKCCNRGVQPFLGDWDDGAWHKFATLDSAQVSFLQDTARSVKAMARCFDPIRQSMGPDDDFYFLSSMFQYDPR